MGGKTAIPSKMSSWTVVKRFLVVFLPLVTLMVVITMTIYSVKAKSEIKIVKNDALNHVNLLTNIIFEHDQILDLIQQTTEN